MIESIEISETATYNTLNTAHGLSKINYFYGANGSGKTTISSVIDENADTPKCRVNWKGNMPLKTLVYNRDFISKNFSSPGTMKGIFTLGEESIEIEQKIAEETKYIEGLEEDIQRRSSTLEGQDGKIENLKKLEHQFQKECWQAKKKHDKKLGQALSPFRGSEENFKNKVIQESNTNSSEFYDLDIIEKKAETIFSSSTSKEPTFNRVNFDKLRSLAEKEIIKRPIIGKNDLHISEIIERLNNSDWVKHGMQFLEKTENYCPFCQQPVGPDLKRTLEDYFDEQFERCMKELYRLQKQYESECSSITDQIRLILENPGSFIPKELLTSELDALSSRFSENIKTIKEKQENPSHSFEIIDLASIEEVINHLIDSANTQASEHNRIIKNLDQEKDALKSQVWKHIIESDLKAEIENYKKEKDSLERAIKGLKGSIKEKEVSAVESRRKIAKLESRTTTTQPTANAINGVLKKYGFKGFYLKPSESGTSYILVRENGSLVDETLSEGEKTFLTFLYFFHLLKGSMEETGISDNKVVVFDDPISSLDSEILFIVSSLIKSLYEEVKNNSSQIKQIFILTHNVYFHKEVSFDSKRTDKCQTHETFWIIKKKDNSSYLEKHDHNPIKSSYDLLWSEIRSANPSKLTIQNTTRRILENYFKIIGNTSLEKISERFEGRDKVICNSLLSWVNDGSHSSGEDLYITVDDDTIDKQLEVFKEIFKKMEHESHYNMMMGIAA